MSGNSPTVQAKFEKWGNVVFWGINYFHNDDRNNTFGISPILGLVDYEFIRRWIGGTTII